MIEVVLHLRAAEQPQREAAAWFIAGDDPRVWLDELAAWHMPLDGVRLYPLPRTTGDQRTCGVLVVPPSGIAPQTTVRAAPYGRHSSRMFLPVLARLDPPASEAEIKAALINAIAVWHPCAGLVGFDEAEGIGVADLLEMPRERLCEWNHARPGSAPPPRLVAILPPPAPSVDDSLADWRDDIGSEAEEELPPAPQEPSNSLLGKAGRAATLAAAQIASILAALAPRTARAPTWVNKMKAWADRQIGRLGNSLAAARRREIDRLLHLLDSDPDRGLRHALPMGDFGHRWAGPPGSRLTPRDVKFSLDRLGGGGRVDPWQIEFDQQHELRRRYRELANREVQLGRHRRAAYIFAELLGDLAAAASALEQGGHDREAAALYRERLSRPLDAARCLQRCGGWEEAIGIYTDQREFEKAAELLMRLDRPSQAAAMYRRAAERWVEQGDRPRAAKLLEEKLAAIDEAIELLAAAWPSTAHAGGCLGELFKLLGRHARHEESAAWIARLRDEQGSRVQIGRAVTVLADVARTYPEPVARKLAADTTRVLAGRRLPKADPDEAAALVRAVRSLVPQDELLGRDAARWLARSRKPPEVKKPRVEVAKKQCAIIESGRHRLPGDVTYKTLLPLKRGFIAAGFTSRGVAAVWWTEFEGDFDRVDWNRPLAEMHPLLLAGHDEFRYGVIASIGGPPFEPQGALGTPAWFTPETLAVAATTLGVWWSIDNQLLLTAFHGDGLQLSSRQFSLTELGVRFEPRDELPERLAVMLARRDDVFIGIGHSLIKVQNDRIEETTLTGWVRRMMAAPLVLQLRLAAGFEDYGAAVIWDDLNGREIVNIADGLERPELTFTLDGLLIAADERDLHIYSTSNRSVTLRGRLAGPRRPLAGLVPGERPGEFAMLTADGELRCYRIE